MICSILCEFMKGLDNIMRGGYYENSILSVYEERRTDTDVNE